MAPRAERVFLFLFLFLLFLFLFLFLFSFVPLNEGHPDKICDQVSGAVLDACPVAGKIDCETVVRGVVKNIGFDPFIDDLSSVDSKGLNYQDCEVLVRVNKQSPDIAGGVHVGKDDFDVGASDQGIMFGYASGETEDAMPLTHLMATRLGKTLNDVRKNGELWWLRPDGKIEVTIRRPI